MVISQNSNRKLMQGVTYGDISCLNGPSPSPKQLVKCLRPSTDADFLSHQTRAQPLSLHF